MVSKKDLLSAFFLLFILLPVNLFPQVNKFVGTVFFNANGIHITGNDKGYWQSSSGSIFGGGGISGGICVKRNLNKKIYFNFEMRYIQKGSVYTYLNEYGTESDELLRLNYLEIPIQLGYIFKRNKKEFLFETGFGFARLFNTKFKKSGFTDRNAYPNIDKFKKQDISWIGSFKYPLNQKGKKNLLFGLRFSYSLFTIHQYYKIRNMDYGIQLEYVFSK